MINTSLDILSVSLALKDLAVEQFVIKAYGQDNLATFHAVQPDFCILVVQDQRGLSLATKIRTANPTIPLVFIADNLSKSMHRSIRQLQPVHLLSPDATAPQMKQVFALAQQENQRTVGYQP